MINKINCPWCGKYTKEPGTYHKSTLYCPNCAHKYSRGFTKLSFFIILLCIFFLLFLDASINSEILNSIIIFVLLIYLIKLPIKKIDYNEKNFVIKKYIVTIKYKNLILMIMKLLRIKKYSIYKIHIINCQDFYVSVNKIHIKKKNLVLELSTLPLSIYPSCDFKDQKAELFYKDKYICNCNFI